MRNKLGVLSFLLAAALGSQSAFADQLITNGGFETGDFTSWTVSGPITTSASPSVFYGVDAQDNYSGTYGAYMSTEPGQSPLVLTQNVSVLSNHAYVLSFDLANLGGPLTGFPNSFAITLNGNTLYTLTNASVIAYQPFTVNFTTAVTAPASEAFAIASTNTAAYFSLDNVSVASAAVPEPASFLLVVPVLGTFLLRRRKAA